VGTARDAIATEVKNRDVSSAIEIEGGGAGARIRVKRIGDLERRGSRIDLVPTRYPNPARVSRDGYEGMRWRGLAGGAAGNGGEVPGGEEAGADGEVDSNRAQHRSFW
jgi:hypothetical protein